MPLTSKQQEWRNLVSPSSAGGGVVRQTTTGLTFSRSWLKHLAQETMDIAQQGYYTNTQGQRVDVQEALQSAIHESQHYHSSHVFAKPSTRTTSSGGTFFSKEQQTILICYASSLQVASELVHHYERNNSDSDTISATAVPAHIGVLCSASAKNPSKFLRGTVSQEEVICRSSLLYPCLAQYEFLPHHFYVVNNSPKYKDANTSSACAIFSPRVPVIRHDPDVRGTLLDDYYECSFVSIPAPNAFVLGGQDFDDSDNTNDNDNSNNSNGDDNDQQVVPKAQKPGSTDEVEHITLHQALHDRIYRALSMFALNGCTDLVLCAFGCGVHGNSPQAVATIFRQELETTFRGCFRTVVFAVQPSRTGNYKAFQQIFPDATAV